jgi:hypothetical protein
MREKVDPFLGTVAKAGVQLMPPRRNPSLMPGRRAAEPVPIRAKMIDHRVRRAR